MPASPSPPDPRPQGALDFRLAVLEIFRGPWDQAGFHPRTGHLSVPGGVHLLPLPPYSPELNPVEKIGAFIKDAVCNKVWESLAQIEAAISAELQPLWQIPQRVAQLVGHHGWLAAQLNASAKICQSR